MRRTDVLLLLLLVILLNDFSPSPANSYPLTLPQVMDITLYSNDDPRFTSLIHFNGTVFNQILFPAIESIMKWPYEWWKSVPLNSSMYTGPLKAKRLSTKNRVFRALLYFVGTSIKVLIQLFGDRKDTVYKDLEHFAIAVVKAHSAEYLSLPTPGTFEYDQQIGVGTHGDVFKDSVYLMDCTTMKIRRPTLDQRDFYDGHSRTHCFKFLTVNTMDTGEARFVSNATPGRHNDITVLNNSLLCKQQNLFVHHQHTILSDGIFGFYGHPLLTRYSHRDAGELSYQQRLYNQYHSTQRVLIENYYGRMKTCFPGIFSEFALDINKAELFFKCSAILTNMLIRHQSPLR